MNALQRQNANRIIAGAMGKVTAVWFVPVVSGLACNHLEAGMVEKVLIAVGRQPSPSECNALFWFHRKKYLLVNAATYIPWVGTSVQLLEVFVLGQFVLTCCDQCIDLTDERGMERAWAEVEPEMWSSQSAVTFYESNSDRPFPPEIRSKFMKAIDAVATTVRGINKIPGAGVVQEYAGEKVRRGIEYVAGPGGEAAKKLLGKAWQAGRSASSKLLR